jgi:RNA 2',3'-cyclic 3'-phosphodiesterase
VNADERARLFLALELPPAVREALVRWRSSEAVAGADRLRLIRAEDLHVTLCFLGLQPVSAVGSVLAASAVAAGCPAAGLRVLEGIWLPPRRARVLAVKLEDASGALAAVQRRLARALAEGGWYAPEKRPFLAHVTVARVARDGRVRGDRGLGAPPELRFLGSRVTLFRSRLSAAGARYEPLGTVALS